VDKLNQALAKGYEGLRLTGNTFWLEKKDWKKFTDYENEVDNVISKYRMVAVCTYSLDKCGANEVIDVISNHRFVLIRREGKWEVIESSERKRTEESIAQLASFPELNPNPVVEVDLTGHVYYLNPATKTLFPDLQMAGIQHPWLKDLEALAQMFEHKGKGSHVRELKIGDTWYQQIIYYVWEGKRLRIYGLDITERKQAEEALKNALEGFKQRGAEISALLEGSRAVLEYHEFKDSAQSIFDSCKNLIGATTGYIALLSKNGAENEVLFLDSGELSCMVDPSLPMPIRGLREEAYRTGKTVFHNNFSKSEYLKFMPKGHADLRNVLFAPLVIKEKVTGLIGLANKPDSFTENDARMASAFGELAAIALHNSRTLESLEASEERFRSVVQTANDTIISVDSRGNIVFWNKSAEIIFGYSADEAISKPLTFIMPERFREDHRKGMNRLVSTGKSKMVGKTFETFGLRKDGSEFPIDLSLATWETREGIFFTGIIRDITERKQMEEELRKSRDELEIRVQERTAELMSVVEALQDEMAKREQAEEALREQSQILEAFFTSTITPLVFLDRNFNFVRVNEAYAKACHREASEFHGRNHFEFYPSEAMKIFEQVVETRKPYQAIARPFTFPDHPEWGTTYWDWNLTPILDDTGETEFLVFSLEDVTKRKRAEEAIKAERQRLNNVLEILPAYLILLAPDYHVPFANRFFRERFGESHGRRCFDYLFGRSEPCETCETYRVLKTMAPHVWEWTGPDGRNYDVFDFPFTDVDGSTLILEMGIDITERKQAEEQLKTTSLYARSLIEASLDPLVTISRDGKIMDVNSATELITGVPRNQLIGSDFLDYFIEPKKAREGYQQVFKTGSVRDYPLSIRHTSGRITNVLYNASLYRNEIGEVQGIFAAARDITERKRAEDALKESESRLRALSSQLLTVQENERKRIAQDIHDSIGQSLSAIKFRVENILEQTGKGPAKKMVQPIHALIPIIQQSIEESRRIQMDLRPSVLDDLGIVVACSWFCREFQTTFPDIHIEKKIEIEEDEVPQSLKTVIYRIMQEAINNIAKHSKASAVSVSLKKREGEIDLIIQDNGQGFDIKETISANGYRRGLGLNSMRERTELSGGTFVIESTAGKGTTIRAEWPIS
jgi:PAS domain S-box-containing protein